MKILYLHGLYSKPGGKKPSFLLGRGYEVSNPGMPDDDFAASVRIANEAYAASPPNLVIGSSRGGAVALNMDSGSTPLILIAPAWRKWGLANRAKPGTTILHSEHDAVIPIADSRLLLQASLLPESALIVVGLDHNMIDEEAFQALINAIEKPRAL
ncbi:alpha/beta hydrolase [Singulisphaera sp. PoT]|uniref:alpha/beta hydrolase n=1 Tax=Singulisphaera sp. PoT TaxID=3411797 RepID=UPI003BF4A91B